MENGDMSGMTMDTSNMTMDASQMNMAFYSGTMTTLYSNNWMPTTTGGYAGTCIFLIILAMVFRSLFALRTIMGARWRARAYNRRYIVVADKQPISERLQQTDPDLKAGVLTVNGIDESIRVVTNDVRGPVPFRLSQDIPRAAMYTVIVGVGYLLMLAVMTLNVGYYLSILGGSFLGELAVGRYIVDGADHAH